MQKFIVDLTNEDTTLITDNQLECFVVDSSLGKDNIRMLQQEVVKYNKILLIKGIDACVICNELGCDGVLVDLSASEH